MGDFTPPGSLLPRIELCDSESLQTYQFEMLVLPAAAQNLRGSRQASRAAEPRESLCAVILWLSVLGKYKVFEMTIIVLYKLILLNSIKCTFVLAFLYFSTFYLQGNISMYNFEIYLIKKNNNNKKKTHRYDNDFGSTPFLRDTDVIM